MIDSDIAENLGLTDVNVEGCIAWMLRLLKFTSREELVPVRFERSVTVQ